MLRWSEFGLFAVAGGLLLVLALYLAVPGVSALLTMKLIDRQPEQ
jgi:uncharacterized SAM-binding protein YcdF (DUF218 family)